MFSAQAHKSHSGYKVVENSTVFQDLQGLVRVMRLCGGEATLGTEACFCTLPAKSHAE